MDRLVLALIVAAALVGCGSKEVTTATTDGEKAEIAQSKAAWDNEKIAAFQKAHKEARSGADELSNGTQATPAGPQK